MAARFKRRDILGVDIGGSKLLMGLIDPEGKVNQKRRMPLAPYTSKNQIIDAITMLGRQLIAESPDTAIDAIGVTIPGLVDTERGLWLYSCFSGIKDFPIAAELSDLFQLPVFINNDVNACACGELLYGVCRNTRDFIWVTVSNGIGGGLILNGRLYEGPGGCSGEIGHVIVAEENGNPCDCGNIGCLEAHASGRAIAANYRGKACPDYPSDEMITAKIVAERARAGDGDALRVYGEAGYYLGKAIAGAVNMLNPQKVILGGGVSMESDLFMPELIKAVNSRAFKAANRDLIIELTGLQYDAALIGAAAVARMRSGEAVL